MLSHDLKPTLVSNLLHDETTKGLSLTKHTVSASGAMIFDPTIRCPRTWRRPVVFVLIPSLDRNWASSEKNLIKYR